VKTALLLFSVLGLSADAALAQSVSPQALPVAAEIAAPKDAPFHARSPCKSMPPTRCATSSASTRPFRLRRRADDASLSALDSGNHAPTGRIDQVAGFPSAPGQAAGMVARSRRCLRLSNQCARGAAALDLDFQI